MVSPGLNGSIDCGRSMSEGSEISLSDYLETIEILQEEVARLEQELQLRDARSQESMLDDIAAKQEEQARVAATEETAIAQDGEFERLKSELADRDETIVLLLDELERVDEAQRASKAEWEQLTGWVAELEHRVEGQDGDAVLRLEHQLATLQQKAEGLERKSEQDRRGWEAQRQIYQQEITQLQGALDQLTESARASGSPDDRDAVASAVDPNVVEALQAENTRLRAAWQELVDAAPPPRFPNRRKPSSRKA